MSPMLHPRLLHGPVAKTVFLWIAVVAITGLLAIGLASKNHAGLSPTPPIYAPR